MPNYMGGGKSPMKMPGGGMTPEKKKSKFVARDLLKALEDFESEKMNEMSLTGRGMSNKDARDLLKQLVLMSRSRRQGLGAPPRVMKKGGKTKEKNGKTNPAFFQVLPKETPKQMKRRLEQEKVDKMYPGGAPYDDDAPARRRSMKKGGKFPDLNKDGKITMADILMGRGVKRGKK